MFELKHGNNINLPLIHRFHELGYQTYRLIPGLNALVSFDPSQAFDKYRLNLFACKTDKAQELETNGVITPSWVEQAPLPDSTLAQDTISQLAYASALDNVMHASTSPTQDIYQAIFNAYLLSQSADENMTIRAAYLKFALTRMQDLLAKGEASIARLITFSRIAFDAGERSLGISILVHLMNIYREQNEPVIDDLLLPAVKRYEQIDPESRLHDWLTSSIAEQYILKHAFSTYFTGAKTLPLFEELARWGFMDESMSRRHQLLKSHLSNKQFNKV